MQRTDLPQGTTLSSKSVNYFATISQRYQLVLDQLAPLAILRWTSTCSLFIIFFFRIIHLQGWYIIAYALGIYMLNLFLLFLTPKIDPSLEEEEQEATGLPTQADQEFRPFIRRLPEFKFWHSITRAILLSIFCTFFEAFNVPVFWPILLVYFCILFVVTMRRQISHMIKYKYVPWDIGKKQYSGK